MKRIPEVTVERLVKYLRFVEEMEKEGMRNLTAKQIAESLGLNPHLVRKDLAYFGQFGKRGKGYETEKLRETLRKIMGLDKRWKVALVGVGNLGSALLRYPGFKERGFEVICAFDASPQKIGKQIEDVKIESMDRMEELIGKKDIKIAILAIPKEAAEEVSDRLVKAGIMGILNFAPRHLQYSYPFRVLNVDLSLYLESLTFYLENDGKKNLSM